MSIQCEYRLLYIKSAGLSVFNFCHHLYILLHHFQFLNNIVAEYCTFYRDCEWDYTHDILFNKHIINVTNSCVLLLYTRILTNLSTLVSSSLSSGFIFFHKEPYLSFLFMPFISFSLKNFKKCLPSEGFRSSR